MAELDMRGHPCPLPVIRAKKELAGLAPGDHLDVLVDNEAARDNLKKLAAGRGSGCESVTMPDGDYKVTIQAALADATCGDDNGDLAVAIGTDRMGTGDDDLGRALLKSFIFSLTELDVPPAVVLFYNGGVHLACKGSAALTDLEALSRKGVTVMACGACLNHFGKTKELQVGSVTNMFTIVETLATAARTIHLT